MIIMLTMKRNQFGLSYFAPFMLWHSLAVNTAEMMLASAQVIGHRTRRMASAGAIPNARDRREFALMGREKVDAGARSVLAMTSHLSNRNQQLRAQAFGNMLRSASALMMLATSRTPAQVIARQLAVARMLGNSAVSLAEASKGAAQLAHRGLKPLHSKATANAKRLGRRS